MHTAHSVKPVSQFPAQLTGFWYQVSRSSRVDLEKLPDRVDHLVQVFLRHRIGDDDVAVLFPQGTLRGDVQGVRRRSSGAHGEGKLWSCFWWQR